MPRCVGWGRGVGWGLDPSRGDSSSVSTDSGRLHAAHGKGEINLHAHAYTCFVPCVICSDAYRSPRTVNNGWTSTHIT